MKFIPSAARRKSPVSALVDGPPRLRRRRSAATDEETPNFHTRDFFIKKIVKIIFLLSFITSITLTFYPIPLPNIDLISTKIKEFKPVLEPIEEEPFSRYFDGTKYEFAPLLNYEIYGLVVEKYDSDSLLDVMHENDPAQTKDLCVVWGESIKNGTYLEGKYSHGEFTCFYEFGRDTKVIINPNELANTHLIPTTDELKKIINNTNIGDQVHIKGKVTSYSFFDEDGNKIGSRGTSTTLDDNRCEVVLVSDYEVIKKDLNPLKIMRDLSYKTLIISTVTGISLFLLPFP